MLSVLSVKRQLLVGFSVLLSTALAQPAWSKPTTSAVEIKVWHRLTGAQAKTFQELVTQFNRDQSEVQVSLDYVADLPDRLVRAGKGGEAAGLPAWVQWTGSDAAQLARALPQGIETVQELLRPLSTDAGQLSSAATLPFLDAQGRWQALPLTPAIPVLMARTDGLKRAGLDMAAAPPRTWRDLQSMLVKVRESGAVCGLASIDPAWVHVENLSAWHRQPYASQGATPEFTFNSLLHVRHVALMLSWSRSDLMVVKRADAPAEKWAQGECPIALAPSTSMSTVSSGTASAIAVAPMPLWEEISLQQGTLLPDGDGLYMPRKLSAEQRQAALKFAAWWLTPVIAAEWHQRVGTVPFTEAVYLASKRGGFYSAVPGWESLSARLAANNSNLMAPSVRVEDRRAVLQLIESELESGFAAGKAPKAALDDAVRAANRFVHGVSPGRIHRPERSKPTDHRRHGAKSVGRD